MRKRSFPIGSRGFRKVGRVYGHYKGRELFEYPCLKGCAGGRCCHFDCRLAALREAGRADVADRLEANAGARDWLANWGKLLYDPEKHGRDGKRRKLAAQIVRGMRAATVGYADAVVGGCWVDVLIDK